MQTLMEWFTGRDEIGFRSYDFIAERPIWEKGWFLISVAIAVAGLAGYFWMSLK